MLWKKESNKENDAMYVDIFEQNGGQAHWQDEYESWKANEKYSTLTKNDMASKQKREEGNKLFGKQKWPEAMEKYNESICLAEPKSVHFSLACGNRSLCFFKMEMYSECLIDINFAVGSGYPKHLMHKLIQREKDCVKQMTDDPSKAVFGSNERTKLNFEPDEKFPSMANVLKIERDNQGNYSVFANEDIDVGQVVVVEKPFNSYLYTRFGSKCNICLRTNVNLFPCEKCTVAMFCNECGINPIHKYECGMQLFDGRIDKEKASRNGHHMSDLRTLLMVINLFSDADDLMNFVEETLSSDQKELPASLDDAKSKYRTFLKLRTSPELNQMKDLVSMTWLLYKYTLDIPHIASIFELEKHRRFLMHLIGHHVRIGKNDTSMVRIYCPRMETLFDFVSLMSRYFNRSFEQPFSHCATNVMMNCDPDGNAVYTICRPVKKGEELLFAYCMRHSTNVKKRMESCSKCKESAVAREQQQKIALDPDFQYFLAKGFVYNVDKEIPNLLQKCNSFLKRYGRIVCSDEVDSILRAYEDLQLMKWTESSNTIVACRCTNLLDEFDSEF